MASVNNSDFFLVNRNDVSFKVQSQNLMAYLEDTDYMLINRSDVTLKINGADVRASLASGSPLSPAVPPFGGLATTETVLNSADGKVEFSLDGSTYSTNLTVPLNTFYYVDWGTDILSAAHGDPYTAQITASYTDLGTSSTIDFDINAIDKLPDPFSFTPLTDVPSGSEYFSDIVSPVETINAPAQIWVTSDAPSFKLRVGDGVWFDPPAVPGSAYVSHNQEIQLRHTLGAESLTTYTTTVFIGHGTNAGEFESADFTTTTQLSTINTPSITSPSGSGVAWDFSTATASAFGGSGIGAHTASDWQIATDAAFTNIVQQTLDDTTNLTTWDRPFVGLTWSTTHYIRVRYKDEFGTISDWGETSIVIESAAGKNYSELWDRPMQGSNIFNSGTGFVYQYQNQSGTPEYATWLLETPIGSSWEVRFKIQSSYGYGQSGLVNGTVSTGNMYNSTGPRTISGTGPLQSVRVISYMREGGNAPQNLGIEYIKVDGQYLTD